MEGSDDIICPRFSISMGGKALYKDARLALGRAIEDEGTPGVSMVRGGEADGSRRLSATLGDSRRLSAGGWPMAEQTAMRKMCGSMGGSR